MDIVLYPDPRLRAKNKAIDDFDEALAQIARDMFDLMYATSGVGLAAPQVGLNIKLLVFNSSGDADDTGSEIVLCNPKIVYKHKDKESAEEGCLSFPQVFGNVLRHTAVKVEAQNLLGEKIEVSFDDWQARIFQHENDHLEGMLFIDRMTPVSKEMVKGQLLNLREDYAADADS
ncbi:MAG: peptide deformylase [Planctomycetes bacterium]|nr:peptide deformylase [Planctomycetota bacterium]